MEEERQGEGGLDEKYLRMICLRMSMVEDVVVLLLDAWRGMFWFVCGGSRCKLSLEWLRIGEEWLLICLDDCIFWSVRIRQRCLWLW
jgi:hypothetical protein